MACRKSPFIGGDEEGRVRPEGFVMRQEDGVTLHSDGLPWWLFDMRPQGYLGRAYAARHGAALGLPARLTEWTDTHVLRALLAHGHDAVGNVLLGEAARARFLALPHPAPLSEADKPAAYARRAREATQGEQPGSSAGGEQPKFAACSLTPEGARHVLVKFSEPEPGPVSERWRDLLLAEHLALETLRAAALPAARTCLIDHAGQRFLESVRFDRSGPLGRCGMFSLAALDAEFVGAGSSGWPEITRRLADAGVIDPAAVEGAALLWAFGSLIGNTDMHSGNLSFLAAHGRPYALAPAYDMTPMAFAPRSGGGLPDSLSEAQIRSNVSNAVWRQASELAQEYVARLEGEGRFSARFAACVAALRGHVEGAAGRIGRLG